jgi:hypothetical protein
LLLSRKYFSACREKIFADKKARPSGPRTPAETCVDDLPERLHRARRPSIFIPAGFVSITMRVQIFSHGRPVEFDNGSPRNGIVGMFVCFCHIKRCLAVAAIFFVSDLNIQNRPDATDSEYT